ncbi:MAG: GtrA family protein [Desulfobulbales bacterium]|nr:GtrA family protein [Desulfobulbales bacterium]
MQQSDNPADYTRGIRQFSKFIIVGFSNFVVSFAVFFLFYNYLKLSGFLFTVLGSAGNSLENILNGFGVASIDAALANTVGYSAGVINSFIWNKVWTFKVKHETAAQFSRFLVLNVCCLLFSSACLFLFTDYLGLAYLPVWLITMSLVTMINFFSSRIWVFRHGNAAV